MTRGFTVKEVASLLELRDAVERALASGAVHYSLSGQRLCTVDEIVESFLKDGRVIVK